ncbi:hypothetical protein BHM03_00033100, partial [Ensete ventricosum]
MLWPHRRRCHCCFDDVITSPLSMLPRSPARCRRPWVARAPSSLSPAFSPARGERSRRRFLI